MTSGTPGIRSRSRLGWKLRRAPRAINRDDEWRGPLGRGAKPDPHRGNGWASLYQWTGFRSLGAEFRSLALVAALQNFDKRNLQYSWPREKCAEAESRISTSRNLQYASKQKQKAEAQKRRKQTRAEAEMRRSRYFDEQKAEMRQTRSRNVQYPSSVICAEAET